MYSQEQERVGVGESRRREKTIEEKGENLRGREKTLGGREKTFGRWEKTLGRWEKNPRGEGPQRRRENARRPRPLLLQVIPRAISMRDHAHPRSQYRVYICKCVRTAQAYTYAPHTLGGQRGRGALGRGMPPQRNTHTYASMHCTREYVHTFTHG